MHFSGMEPEALFHELLGLGDHWEVREVAYEAGEVRLVIHERKSLFGSLGCECEGGQLSCYDHAPKRTWRHLNVFEHTCYIECRLPRTRCRRCGKVSTVKAPWEGRLPGLTLLFEAFALTLLREMPVRAAARLLGLHDTRAWRLLKAYVAPAYARVDLRWLRQLGCDELSARKGHDYLTVFADMQQRRVIFATPGRDAGTWARLAAELPRHNACAGQITHVSIDMSAPYAAGAACQCPGATIVWDRFHVMKRLGQALDEVRQREARQLRRQHPGLPRKKAMWLWRHNPEALRPDQAQMLAELSRTHRLTSKAYQMRLSLRELYEQCTEAAQLHDQLLRWCRWVKGYARRHPFLFAPMAKAAQSVRAHLEGIVAFAQSGLTNAYLEGLFSVFSAVKRKARGYRSAENLITMLYFTAAKLDIHQNLHPR